MGRQNTFKVHRTVFSYKPRRSQQFSLACDLEALPSVHLPLATQQLHQPFWRSSRPVHLRQVVFDARKHPKRHSDDSASSAALHCRWPQPSPCRTGHQAVARRRDTAAGLLLQRPCLVWRERLQLEIARPPRTTRLLIPAEFFRQPSSGCQRNHVRPNSRLQLLRNLQKRWKGAVPEVACEPFQEQQERRGREFRERRRPHQSVHVVPGEECDQL